MEQTAPAPRPAAGAKLEELEALRGLAAFYVFIHHAAQFYLQRELGPWVGLFRGGQAAVMIFFLLSGFVIYLNAYAPGRRIAFGRYLALRAFRIYPLFLVSLLLSFLLMWWYFGVLPQPDPVQMAGNLFMLQDANKTGVLFFPVFGNGPTWSLSYEWAYYLLSFPLLAAATGVRGRLAGVIVAAVAGLAVHNVWPNQISLVLSLFPVWLAGAAVAEQYQREGRVTAAGQAGTLLLLLGYGLAWGAIIASASPGGEIDWWHSPWIELRQYWTAVAILVLGLAWNHFGFAGFHRLFGWARVLGPCSYALYVLHFPLVLFAATRHITGSRWLDFFLVWLPLILGLSYLLEYLLYTRLRPLLFARRRK